jgi:lipopolysaccharide export system protein LptA
MKNKISKISECIYCRRVSSLFIFYFPFFIFYFCVYAADIEAGRMEILNTPEGKVTVFMDGVTIVDRETKITAQNARFYENKNLAVVQDSVKITNPSAVIKSDIANYYMNERKTILKGNVSVIQESLEIRAPELTVEYQKDRASAQNGFLIIEKPHSLQIKGKSGEYFLNKEEGMIDSLPYLEIKKNETLKVTSQRLSFKNKEKYAVASGKVMVSSGKAVLECDTLIFNWEKDSGKALGEPVLKENGNEVSGKTIYFFTKEGGLERLEVEGDAYGLYFNEQGDKVEIGGESLGLLFSSGKTNSITVKNVQLGKLFRRGEKS